MVPRRCPTPGVPSHDDASTAGRVPSPQGRRSGGCWAPRTRRRSTSGSRSPRTSTSSSTTSSCATARCRGARSRCGCRASSPTSAPGTRAPASTRTCSSSPTGCCRPRRSRRREITTTRVEPEVYVPPRPGAEVQRATGAQRDQALFFDRMERKLPIGLGRDGQPLFANLDFIDGTRGAHVNISGISGVATKTTYATFLLYSLFNSGVLGDDATNTHALIFNVKGEDLLFLDHDNIAARRRRSATATARSGSRPARSSRSRCSRRPARATPAPRPTSPAARRVSTASTGRSPSSSSSELLPFAFADAEDDRQQYTMVVHNVGAALKRYGAAAERRRVAHRRRRRSAPTATSSSSSSPRSPTRSNGRSGPARRPDSAR